ncbi:CPBP family intramembrane glutamic endopeptidase [Actinoalloteichus hymeniacidonis]|uniref:Metal-dependent membrane protease n=1 Tax=Actinoalloteichus hymeniacidonis TaxID=340345 RepID=A0AAC9HMN1_9PSEU|nr:type II CAAX endopeptidase family protein [Actinoalloteichus hymeniacidonis]AOS62063.1 putative metal-dependent membrane protease [Actinoalloteichus hymeniacidonis]MBB5909915.1 membrane protease YdiL (CAAX protease family) [Actinoalloteichus hymeniacidonis]
MSTSASNTGKYSGDLVLFMAIAFVVSWALWGVAIAMGGPAVNPAATLPHLVGAFGPAIAALVIRIRRGRRGEPVPEHAVRSRFKTLGWVPVLMVLASATVLSGGLLAGVSGSAPMPSVDTAMAVLTAQSPVMFLAMMVISGPLAEEPGWRGTAYPRMRASMSRLQIGLVLGTIWAVWHLPLFFIAGTVQSQLGLATPSGVLFAVSSIPMAMLCCCAYERAGVVASVAVHFAVNLTMVLTNVQAPVTLALIMGIQAIVVAILLATGKDKAASGAPAATSDEPKVAENA